MIRRRILPRLLAAGVLVLALAGCVRFQADLALNPGDLVDGQIIVAVLDSEKTDESRATALGYVSDITSTLLGSLTDEEGVSTREYERDDYVGRMIEFDNVGLDAFSGQQPESLRFVREGDSYVFTGVLDFSEQSLPSDDSSDDDGNLRVTLTFPGEVTAQRNGEVSGTTITWTAALDERVEMSATGGANPPGPPVALIVGVALAVVVLLVAAGAAVLVLRSRRARAAVPATETGELPEA